jgi:hypothetical protein
MTCAFCRPGTCGLIGKRCQRARSANGRNSLPAHLPHNLQQLLFEQVVAIRGEPMRHELATFLHDQHPRTSDPPTETREVPEPDSLGG